jgi:prepilin-type N-terminal cleavage/methylation domain-containing protein
VNRARPFGPQKLTTSMKRPNSAGFTLIEMMLVVCVMGIVAAMATLQISSVRPGMQGDGAMRAVMAELNGAREMAIAQRRYMEVRFVGTNRIQVIRRDLPNGTTTLRDVAFEAGVEYGLVTGIGDTPDGFGNDSATSFGAATAIMFSTDGGLIDTAGAPVNGTVFVAIPDQALSFRAVTVQGSTGRVRGYRWTGSQWRQA